MQIIVGGDLVPTDVNIDLFSSADLSTLLGKELLQIWNAVDVRIFNLEVPLTEKDTPIIKCGPNLIAPTSTVNGIKALNPSVVGIANNHILDQDERGLKSTIDVLNRHNIPFVGAGSNITEANKPYIIKKDGTTVGIYACTETEFSIATESTSGANQFDPFESLDHIKQLKSQCDHIIVLYHGGKEHYRYPSPYLQKICRKMAEKGADLILCQHSHCIGSYEEYNDSTIVYGQGNFIFNKYDNEFWNTSLLIKIDINKKIAIEYIPIIKHEKGISLAVGNDMQNILKGFHYRSKEILQEGFIKQRYHEFARLNLLHYLRQISGMNKWMSRIDRYFFKGVLTERKYNKKKLLMLQNYIECEAHRELVLAGLKGEITSETK